MLEYLNRYKDRCDLEALLKIKEERELWKKYKNCTQYLHTLDKLPEISNKIYNYNSSAADVTFDLDAQKIEVIKECAKEMIPWKKGPFKIGELEIDSEWRSDLKWDRFKEIVGPLKDKTVLDVGCSNGYFMFKMAKENPELLMGIDPALHCYYQYKFLNHFFNYPFMEFELFGIEHLSYFKNMFDTILFMGIVYHHRNPILQLQNILSALKPGGQAILETIGIPGDESYALFPEDRYANMKNVWFVPTISCFENWIKRAKFVDIEIISSTQLTFDEQRLTSWCPPPHQSLEDFLDSNDHTKTVEGHPAPMRFLISAKKRPR